MCAIFLNNSLISKKYLLFTIKYLRGISFRDNQLNLNYLIIHISFLNRYIYKMYFYNF